MISRDFTTSQGQDSSPCNVYFLQNTQTTRWLYHEDKIDGLVQERRNSIAKAL